LYETTGYGKLQRALSSSMSRPTRGQSVPFLIGGAAFLASTVAAGMLGLRFDATPVGFLWQYLDADILQHDLLRGLYYLHSQPPLFNLYLGVVLKLFPTAAAAAFSVGHQAVALALLIGVAWVLRQLQVPNLITALLCLLLALHPTFLVHGRWLFYTLPVGLLLILSAAALLRYCAGGRAAWAHTFCWLTATLMLTRAIFHPVWFVATLSVICLLIAPRLRRRLLVSAIVPLLVVNLWYLKNLELVGMYSASSWLGMNLRRTLGLAPAEQAALLKAGRLPAVWAEVNGFPLDLDRYPDYLTPAALPLHRAIDAAYKANGYWNFNHRAYARISRDMLRGDVEFIKSYPTRYALRVLDALRLFLQPGPRFVIIDRYYPQTFGTAVARYRDVANTFLFLQPVVSEAPSSFTWLATPNLLWVGFPVLVLFGVMCTIGHPRIVLSGAPAHARPVIAYLTATVIWFTLCSTLFEFGENDRMRIEIDPVLVVLLGCALSALYTATTGRSVLHRAQ
jgi:hypothetical protein